MVVGQVAEGVDALVIGGGPGGTEAALQLARRGREVTLVESDRLGGTCLNVGCIPSKALLELSAVAGGGSRFGVSVSTSIDLPAARAHLTDTVEDLGLALRAQLDRAGVRCLAGRATFTRHDRVLVDTGESTVDLEFRQAVVATGSRPATLAAAPVDHQTVVDSTGALALQRIPEQLVVIGGGYIGLELATAYARLGSKVTVIEARSRLLPEISPAWLGDTVLRAFRQRGIRVELDTAVTSVVGQVVKLDNGHILPADLVIVAVGRRPVADHLGLDRVGAVVEPTGHVRVNASRQAAPSVWAVGDITPGPALAHKATAEARVAAAAMCGEPAAFDPTAVPVVVFADPEIVTVGLDHAALAARGHEPRTARVPLRASGRARTLGGGTGSVEVVADAAGTVWGIHIAGPHVAELAGEAALAVEMAATVEDLATTIHAHPTLGELLAEAAAVIEHERRPP